MAGEKRGLVVACVLLACIALMPACRQPDSLTPAPPSTTPGSIVLPSAPSQGLTIGAHTGFTDRPGTAHIVGEVRNDSQENYAEVVVTCAFYDAAGQIVAEREQLAYVDILLPDEKAPFELSLRDPPADIAAYQLSAHGKQTTEQPFTEIAFLQDHGLLDGNDMTLLGEVRNTGGEPVGPISIAAVLYDAAGEILDVGFAFAERNFLLPDGVSPFKLFVGNANGSPAQYELVAYGRRPPQHRLAQRSEIDLADSRHVRQTGGKLTIVGEVINRGERNAAYAKIVGSFYGKEGDLVDVEWAYAWTDVLPPNQRSPFALEILDSPREISHWTLWVEGTQTDTQAPDVLVLEEVDNSVTQGGMALFTGLVHNTGPTHMSAVEVAVTVYTAGDRVHNVAWTWLEEDLAPDATAPFQIEIDAGSDASSFQLYVQGLPRR